MRSMVFTNCANGIRGVRGEVDIHVSPVQHIWHGMALAGNELPILHC